MGFKVALAYMDPVSGSILIQAIVAAAAGSVAFFRKSIGRMFRRLTGKPPDPPAMSAPPADRNRKG
jgi:hypothetical protein